MLWMIYIATSVFVSLKLARISKKYFIETSVIFFTIFLTPAQIAVSEPDYAPSLLTFFFNLIFQQEFSFRVLRPLMLSLTLCIFSLFLHGLKTAWIFNICSVVGKYAALAAIHPWWEIWHLKTDESPTRPGI